MYVRTFCRTPYISGFCSRNWLIAENGLVDTLVAGWVVAELGRVCSFEGDWFKMGLSELDMFTVVSMLVTGCP